MSTTDPANQAAQRAIRKDADRWNWIAPRSFHRDAATSLAVDAAREALAPLQDFHARLALAYMDGDMRSICDLIHEMEPFIYCELEAES